jgi:group I intron endonuclease
MHFKSFKKKSPDLLNLHIIWNKEKSFFTLDKPGIYLIQNKISKKKYVGQTSNIHDRLSNYCDVHYIFNKRASSSIYRAILKSGYQNFSFTILEHCDSKDLSKREQYFINLIKPQYNIRKVVYTDKT